MKLIRLLSVLACIVLVIQGCKKNDTTTEPKLIFKFKFDSTQTRLDNFGNVATMPSGHAGQNPLFNVMSAHYIELAPTAWTALGGGAILYKAPETTAGGSNAIDFSQSVQVGDGGTFFSVPLKSVPAGDYQYLRVSLAYQNFDVKMYIDTSVTYAGTTYPIQQTMPCTIASFVGFNTYLQSYKVKDQTVAVNGNRAQGYWGFETNTSFYGQPYNYLSTGQAPVGATTVVNPISASSPIPPGSCVETAAFDGSSFKINGTETKDIVVTVSLSTQKSFEWVEVVNDGKWEPAKGEYIVDMGLRGIKPIVTR